MRRGLSVSPNVDAASREIVNGRWSAIGAGPGLLALRPGAPSRPAVVLRVDGLHGAAQSYRLDVDARGIRITAADSAGAFYAFATLAQLAERNADGVWRVPCVHVVDAPALQWRVLSDDVSRGPLPTMRYFQERIRTAAAFKLNGYSPYMEHVFVDPKHPLPSPLDGITPDQLRTLDAYAHRFHVALIPEQQTFAHMHETLRWERYAALAETPHGYLLSPADSQGEAYVRDLIADELGAIPNPPFFHVGSDEPIDLGRGQAHDLVQTRGAGAVYVKHVLDVTAFVSGRSAARPMVWDDALERHPELLAQLPKRVVFANWHYGNDPTFQPYIDRIARAGFEQMVDPGALNWNELYPDLPDAFANAERFIGEGRRSHVLGVFQSVWNDDGETLFEASWFPVLYAAAAGWESVPVDPERFVSALPSAFFGSDDARYADDVEALARCATLVHAGSTAPSDRLFWTDPFVTQAPARGGASLDLASLRLAAESAIAHLRLAPAPPLHAQAVRVMELAALRYDLLARNYQIAREARDAYADARANLGAGDRVERDLNVTKYLFWELRDRYLELVPLVRAAWEYENRASHELSVLERYHVAADRAIERADRIAAVAERYASTKELPDFDEAIGAR